MQVHYNGLNPFPTQVHTNYGLNTRLPKQLGWRHSEGRTLAECGAECPTRWLIEAPPACHVFHLIKSPLLLHCERNEPSTCRACWKPHAKIIPEWDTKETNERPPELELKAITNVVLPRCRWRIHVKNAQFALIIPVNERQRGTELLRSFCC